jgi:hypothetical protein
MMNGILWTFKTHYKMAEWYEKAGMAAKFLVAAGTGGLAVIILYDALSQTGTIAAALFVAFVSWTQTVFSFSEKAAKHYSAADRYHSLYEEFDDFTKIKIPDEGRDDENLERQFESLASERRYLNELSPRTTNFWYNRVSESEIQQIPENGVEHIDGVQNTNSAD